MVWLCFGLGFGQRFKLGFALGFWTILWTKASVCTRMHKALGCGLRFGMRFWPVLKLKFGIGIGLRFGVRF